MGARRETASEVEAASGVHTGDALLFVNTGAVAERVERLPWVAHASVHRDLPGTLRIVVTDFSPAAFIRMPGDRFALVAVSGRVIAIVKTVPASTVEIRGEKAVPPVGSLVSPPQVAGVVRQPARAAAQRACARSTWEPCSCSSCAPGDRCASARSTTSRGRVPPRSRCSTISARLRSSTST